MNYLVYQSYGHIDILNECLYSILSLLKHYPGDMNFQILIYTDQPEFFSVLPEDKAKCVPLDKDTIDLYKGPHKFVHRVKIETLLHCSFQFNGKIIYADSDIYFLKPIDELFEKISEESFVMCNKEGEINKGSNLVFKKFAAFVAKNKVYLKLHRINLPENAVMWNAGVLGFPSSRIDILKEVLRINDLIYNNFASHVVEQMSFSFCLSEEGKLHESTDTLFHYWNFKEFRKVLSEFFDHHQNNNSPLEKMIEGVDSVRPDVLIVPKLEYQNLPLIPKALRKLRGTKNRWKLPEYKIK